MSFSLVALKIFAPAIAKTLLEAFHIETKLLSAVLEEVIDNTSEGAVNSLESQKTLSKNIEQIAKQLATDIKPLFEHEATSIKVETRNALVIGVAETLIKARLSSDTLAAINFDEERLKDYLLKVYPQVLIGFSDSEKSLYQQVVALASKRLIGSASQMEGFSLSTASITLQRLEEISHHLKIERELALQSADEYAKNYRRKILEKLDKLEVFGLDKIDDFSKRQSLSTAYINLSANCPDEDDDRKSPLMLMGEDHPEREIRRRSSRVDDAIYNCRRLVIRGSAGAGKSTLLQWIAVRAATQTFTGKLQYWNRKIPFFIRLRDLVFENMSLADSFPAPEDFPKFVAKNFVDTMPKGWVHQYLDRGQALVLIDGVDEIPKQQRQDFFEVLQDLVRDFSDTTFIVTSRPTGLKNSEGGDWEEWEEWVKEQKFANWTLEPMSPANIAEFVTQWHNALPLSSDVLPEDIAQIGANLKYQLCQRPELRRLAATPLLCAMICALHYTRQENLPSARLELYKDCIDMLLNKRDKGRKIKLELDETYPVGLDEAQKIELLQGLALKLMRLNLSTLDSDRVDRHFQEELVKTSLPKTITGKQIRDLFVQRSGLLREPSVNQIDFAHRTFQEYLAAKAALANDNLEELLKYATDDQWREAIIVAAGLARLKERVKLLETLVNRGNSVKLLFEAFINRSNNDRDQKQYLHLLAVACLETATSVEPATREKVLNCAKALLPPKNDDEVPMFAAVGNEIIPLLKYESRYSEEEACRCINVLIQIGSRSAMLMLVDYAKARYQEEDENDSISQAISKGYDVFEQKVYISEVLYRLTSLNLSNMQITDFSTLSGLNHITSLNLIGTQITNLSVLSGLNQLTKLNLSNTQVTDLSALSGLNQLTSLNLSNTQVTDLSTLSGLNQLTSLNLSNTQVTDLSALGGLNQLTSLNLSNTQVTDLSTLSGLNQLNILNFSNTQVTDLSTLSGLNQLNILNFSNTQVTDLSTLSGLNQLFMLDFSNTQVTDLSALSGLNQLNILDLRNTQVTNLSALSGLNQLNILDLRNTQVTNLSALSGLNQLKRLILRNTQVTDLSPLENLSKLTIYSDSQEKSELWKSQGLKVNLISRN